MAKKSLRNELQELVGDKYVCKTFISDVICNKKGKFGLLPGRRVFWAHVGFKKEVTISVEPGFDEIVSKLEDAGFNVELA